MRKNDAVLTVKDLKLVFHTYQGDVKALDGVNLSVKKGEIIGLVGESGCGKSVTALAIAGLLPQNAEILSGKVILDGKNLLEAGKEEVRKARLSEIALVFQDPMTYLNPVLPIGLQIVEIVESDPKFFFRIVAEERLKEISTESSKSEEKKKLESLLSSGSFSKAEFRRLSRLYAISMLRKVRLPDPERVYKMYPFELSGGMRQRAMIAMALARKPKVLLADEITTALDVTVQAQILKLLRELKDEIETSVVLITHDLAVVAEVCDRVAVMYAGNIVEVGDVDRIFTNPLHPYTQGLLESIIRPDEELSELKSIKGSVPNLINPPSGCRFHPRCPKVFQRCPVEKPELVEVEPGHFVSCFLYG
jgi:peptide/nickel transport system ATP-binding protein